MAQSYMVLFFWPFTNLHFGICAFYYFDLKVSETKT